MVLLAILQLDQSAFAPEIAGLLESRAARRVSRGALYATLERLENKGWIEWQMERPADERGGYRKRRFLVTPPGLEELKSARQAMESLASGLDGVLGRSG
ncbi:MAG: PadR family transcriptional regulator [Acidobacteria bacterium]|nr:PadR family transcriptional regulator [Acidobacteriota bacterium]